jgi:hypothetical protein
MVSSIIDIESVESRALGAFETAQALTNAHTPFNVVVVLPLRSGPGEQTLRGGLDAIQERHPLLRSRLEANGKGFRFSPSTNPITLENRDRTGDSMWMRVAEDELGRAVDSEAGPLVRCLRIAGPENSDESELVLTFHHSTMDATSGAKVVAELLTACAAIDRGETPDLGPALLLMPAEDDLFPKTLPGGRRRSSVAGFLLRQAADEAIFRLRTSGGRRPPVHPLGSCRVLCRSLGEGHTTAVVRACRARRLPLNSALNAAMMVAVHRLLYDGESTLFRHFNFADLRPLLRPRVTEEHLGSYHAMLRATVPMPAGADLWSTAAAANRRFSAAARRGDTFHSVRLSAAMMRPILRQQKQRMGTTALSYTGPARLPSRFGSIEASSPEVFISNLTLGPEYTAQVRLADGELRWNIVYLDCDMDRATADRISDEMLAVLRGGAAGGAAGGAS